jgi:hypothetical protein
MDDLTAERWIRLTLLDADPLPTPAPGTAGSPMGSSRGHHRGVRGRRL